jgi:hypothetical protein
MGMMAWLFFGCDSLVENISPKSTLMRIGK